MPAILFLTAYPIEDASCRYRIHQFVTHLQRAGYECAISSFITPALFRALRKKGRFATKVRQTLSCTSRRLSTLAKLSEVDLVVIHREAFPFFAPLMENLVLRLHPKVVFSFDDAIYCGHTNVSTLSHPLLYKAKHGRGYDDVIRRSFHVIAGNRILARHAAELNPNVTVIPTVVDCQQFWCKPVTRNRGPITIGWIGSQSTVSYLAMVEPVLREIASRNPGRVQFRMFGCPDYKLHLPDCQSLPFVLDREAGDIRSLDIGLMPLPDTEWARGKCAFKAIQYMASGVPTVASPVGVTTDLIQHNDNGLIANSPIEWLHAIERLIYDVSLCQHITVNARRTVEERYSLQVWGPRFVSLLDEIRQRGDLVQPSSVAA